MSETINMRDIEDVVAFAADNPDAKMKMVASDVARMIGSAKELGVEDGYKALNSDITGIVKAAVTNLRAREKLLYTRGYDAGFGIGFMAGAALVAGAVLATVIYKVHKEEEQKNV